jgi:hypothetical protein
MARFTLDETVAVCLGPVLVLLLVHALVGTAITIT